MGAEPISLDSARAERGQPVGRAPGREAAGLIAILLLGVVLALPWAISGIALAQDSATELSVEAQKECDLGRAAKRRAVRLAHFQRSQTLAERAVAADDQLADAHFALFCSLGEQMRIDGESFTSAFGFRRMMAALDRTLELNPDHLDALSSKGTFLVRLPAILGGDAAKGERMLWQVIRRDPKAVSARITLAKVSAAQGDREQAIALASEALQLAHSERRADLLREAQATVAELRPAHAEIRMTNP
jgi:cytochrome c-type biogenesis protein CcmH/NrfG